MTRAELKRELARLVKKWSVLLGVADYECSIHLHTHKKMHGNYAEINTDDETRTACIDFNYERLLKEPKEIEKTVVHELLHTRFNEYADFVIDLINEHVEKPQTKRLIQKRIDQHEHKIIVALTNALTRKEK